MGRGRALVFCFVAACTSAYGTNGTESVDAGMEGSLGARCLANGACLADLVCAQGTCRPPADAGGPNRAPDAASDASIDAADDGAAQCPLTKKPVGEGCAASQECCTGKCGEQFACVLACENGGGACPLGSDNACCAGFWCGAQGGTTCGPCIPGGSDAARLGSVLVARSCCSRSANAISGKCN